MNRFFDSPPSLAFALVPAVLPNDAFRARLPHFRIVLFLVLFREG